MTAVIWQSNNAAETLFLIAAIVFTVDALVAALKPAALTGLAGLLTAAGGVLIALGLLAL